MATDELRSLNGGFAGCCLVEGLATVVSATCASDPGFDAAQPHDTVKPARLQCSLEQAAAALSPRGDPPAGWRWRDAYGEALEPEGGWAAHSERTKAAAAAAGGAASQEGLRACAGDVVVGLAQPTDAAPGEEPCASLPPGPPPPLEVLRPKAVAKPGS